VIRNFKQIKPTQRRDHYFSRMEGLRFFMW